MLETTAIAEETTMPKASTKASTVKPKSLHISISKQSLTKIVDKVLPFVERKTPIPVLHHVLVTTDPGSDTITITGTDLDQSLQVVVEAKVISPGQVLIPAHKLAKTLQNLKLVDAGEVTIKAGATDNDNNWIEITCGKLNVKLPGMGVMNYPAIPALEVWQESNVVNAGALLAMIKRSLHAVSETDSRYQILGELVEITEDHVRVVGTDGHRLADCVVKGQYTGKFRYIVPRAAIERLIKLLPEVGQESVEIAWNDKTERIHLRAGDWVMITRPLLGQFPNYDAVIPKSESLRHCATPNASEFAQVVKRVGMYADERSGAIKLELLPGKGLQVSASSTESGSASELYECYVDSASGSPVTLGLSHFYVLDVLNTFGKGDGELVGLHVRHARSAVVWVDPDQSKMMFREVVMPMRI